MPGREVLVEQHALRGQSLRQEFRRRIRPEGGVEALVLEHDDEDVVDAAMIVAIALVPFEAVMVATIVGTRHRARHRRERTQQRGR
jgi:hypothetical protein